MLFKIGNSDLLTVVFYATIAALIAVVYRQGGIEATINGIVRPVK